MPLREEKQVKLRTVVTSGLILLVVAVWIVWWRWDPMMNRLCRGRAGAVSEALAGGGAETGPGDVPGARAEGEWAAALAEAEAGWTDWLGDPPVWPADFVEPTDCAAVEEDLARVCRRLDQDETMKGEGSCQLIGQVTDELMRRPPVLTSELRSYESMLGNVFHLFRVVGAERLGILRDAVRRESEHAEPVAMALYRWMASREVCSRSGRTAIRTEPLYEYAAFLFQTMGGQAYLRRRSPREEALAGLYALLALDRAIEGEHNPHGVDPRADIRRTRELLAAQPLVFGERYATLLDRMEQRWKQREP